MFVFLYFLDLPTTQKIKIYFSRYKGRVFWGIAIGLFLLAGLVCVVLVYQDFLRHKEEGISDDLSIPHSGENNTVISRASAAL